MKKLLLGAVFTGLLFSFFGAVVDSFRKGEMRVQIFEKNILNYELASNLLSVRSRVTGEQPSFSQDVEMAVLESGVINNDIDFRISDPLARVGLPLLNFIRLLTLKPFVDLDASVLLLNRLYIAFYLERTKSYREAVVVYNRLIPLLSGRKGSSQAFVYLHLGYCLSALGDDEKAVVHLRKVVDSYPHTHFSRSAQDLISMIQNHEELQISLASGKFTDHQRAALFYNAGYYMEVKKILRKTTDRDQREDYMYARSMEETGESQEALQLYDSLSRTATDTNIRRQSGRRLLLFGAFLGGGEKMESIARERARENGDIAAVNEVSNLKTAVLPPSMEKLETLANAGDPDLKSFQQIIQQRADDSRSIVDVPTQEPVKIPAQRSKPTSSRPAQEKIAAAENRPVTTANRAATENKPSVPENRPAETETGPAPAETRREETAAVKPAVIPEIGLKIQFTDGRVFPANSLSIRGTIIRIEIAGGGTLQADSHIIDEIRAGEPGAFVIIRTDSGQVLKTSRLLLQEGKIYLSDGADDSSPTRLLEVPARIRASR